MTSHKPAQEVGRLLTELLWRREYATLWQSRQVRTRSSKLNQTAIAQVVTDYLWQAGEWDETDTSLPLKLKHRLNRALLGKAISQQTLEWIIEAFEMEATDARRLRAVLNPVPPGAAAPVDTLRPQPALPIRQNHRTVSVSEHRVIGRDGAPVRHHAVRVITAEDDVVRFYPCRQFSGASKVEMLRGGKITRRHEYAGSSPILEMTLSTPLAVGEFGSLEYEATFEPGSSAATEYRQVAHARASNLDIVIQFDLERLPRRVWWTVWDNYRDGTILDQQSVSLDPDGCVHRYLPYLENAAAGFRWDW